MQEKHVIFNDQGVHPISQVFEEFVTNRFSDYQFSRIQVVHSDTLATRGISLTKNSNVGSLIYYGGNLFLIERHAPFLLPELLKLNLDIYWFDHRGRGASEGDGSVYRMQQDVLDQFDLVARLSKEKPIVVHGVSLGSFMAGHIAQHRDVDALILEASSTNVDDLIDLVTPTYLAPILRISVENSLRSADNLSIVKHTHIPLLVLVGEYDTTTPPPLSKKLYHSSVSRHKKLVIVPEARHGNAIFYGNTMELYQQFIAQAIL